ncbi:MAG: PBP1A family penicillin-binding protein [Candidatus Caldatribacteriota bacterium]|nr:PBP1A family penicillin-binding protein [Candidatus Caldatribacteriota bacterium]
MSPKNKQKRINYFSFSKILLLTLIIFTLAFTTIFIGLITLNTHKISDMIKEHEILDAVNSKVYDINGKIITEFYQENRTPISLSKIPQNLINAFISIEDSDFYKHQGLSIKGILRSQWVNFKNIVLHLNKEARPQGGSTITQQLGINIFLTREISLNRKLQDMLIALQIERYYTKNEIMEMYLNEIYFGHGAYGVQSAAKMYFNKNVRNLNLVECALLAGIPRGPYYYSPIINKEASLKRRNVVLNRMLKLDYISDTDLEKAKQTPIKLNYHNKRDKITAPYFSTYILSQLLEKYGANMVYKGGLSIYTTLDLEMQNFAEISLKDSGHEGALIAIDPQSGYIKAMVGGNNFEKSKFNRATQAYRQPGSAFKPFIYLTALDNGFTPSNIIEDSPITFENGWAPENYEQEFRGPVTLKEAFEHSINVVGVKLLEQVGINKAVNYAHKAGIKSKLRPDLSLALGTSEVSPLEIVSAYATIANLGEKIESTSIIRIEDYTGKLIKENIVQKKKVFKEETCYVLIDMMKGVIERGTGWNAKIGRPAAGKTGTTDDFVDAWFIGFTPDLATAVYIGNDDRKSLGDKMTGGVVAAPIWAKFMKNSLKDYDKTDFTQPDKIVKIPVCKESGLLPTDSCSKIINSAFIKGTEPTSYCTIHQKDLKKPEVKVVPKIKKPYYEEIEKIKEKTREKPIEAKEEEKEETLQSLIEKLKEKYKKQDE